MSGWLTTLWISFLTASLLPSNIVTASTSPPRTYKDMSSVFKSLSKPFPSSRVTLLNRFTRLDLRRGITMGLPG
ncbi:hypothetical protein BC829DRAFT_412299 [Chytridium lagenaria]|nr:hypothetical protein BC829DRAFT_412299 [Chytridium lagenaria]